MLGQAANEVKEILTQAIDQKNEELINCASCFEGAADITLPGVDFTSGGLHPITQMCYDLNDAFRSLGFEVFSEPEITSELYAFDNLNFARSTRPVKAWIHTGLRDMTKREAQSVSA